MATQVYWVEKKLTYFITSDVPLTEEQAQVLVENGVGSLKSVDWDFDPDLHNTQTEVSVK